MQPGPSTAADLHRDSGAPVSSVDARVAPVPPRNDALTTAAWSLAVGVVEAIGLAGLVGQGKAGLGLGLILHAVAMALLVMHVVRIRRRGGTTTMAMLALLTTAAVGPAGAIGTAAIALLTARGQRPSGLLEAWYERISLSVTVDRDTQICDDVGSGRTLNLDGAKPASFLSVIVDGTIAERQTVLGIIARRFHPDYLPMLKLALRSPEAVIRVQAAAVAAHVRPNVSAAFRTAVAGLEAASGSVGGALGLMRALDSLIDSGLLDEGDRRQAVAASGRLGDVVQSYLARGELRLRFRRPIEEAVSLEDTLERLLLRRGQFPALRAARSTRRVLEKRPLARVRRIATTPSKTRLAS